MPTEGVPKRKEYLNSRQISGVNSLIDRFVDNLNIWRIARPPYRSAIKLAFRTRNSNSADWILSSIPASKSKNIRRIIDLIGETGERWDTFKSRIEVTENGVILVNGRRISQSP